MIPASQIVAEAREEAEACQRDMEGRITRANPMLQPECGYPDDPAVTDWPRGHHEAHLALAIRRALRRVAGEAFDAGREFREWERLWGDHPAGKSRRPDDREATITDLCGPEGGTNG